MNKYYVAVCQYYMNHDHKNGVANGLHGFTDKTEAENKPADTYSEYQLNGVPVIEWIFYCETESECENIFENFRIMGIAGIVLKGARYHS